MKRLIWLLVVLMVFVPTIMTAAELHMSLDGTKEYDDKNFDLESKVYFQYQLFRTTNKIYVGYVLQVDLDNIVDKNVELETGIIGYRIEFKNLSFDINNQYFRISFDW